MLSPGYNRAEKAAKAARKKAEEAAIEAAKEAAENAKRVAREGFRQRLQEIDNLLEENREETTKQYKKFSKYPSTEALKELDKYLKHLNQRCGSCLTVNNRGSYLGCSSTCNHGDDVPYPEYCSNHTELCLYCSESICHETYGCNNSACEVNDRG